MFSKTYTVSMSYTWSLFDIIQFHVDMMDDTIES